MSMKGVCECDCERDCYSECESECERVLSVMGCSIPSVLQSPVSVR